MTPSPEETKSGQDALRRISVTFATRIQKVKNRFIRVGLLGLGITFCFYKLGGGVVDLLIAAALGFAPIFIIIFCIGLERAIDKATLRKLRKKYGPEIDQELGPTFPV